MSSVSRIVAPIFRRSVSTSSPAQAKQLAPEIQTKFDQLKKNQEFFQREDGNWVFMKKPTDRVQLGLILAGTFIGLMYNFKFCYDKVTGKY